MRLFSPAKLNLFFRILRKRSDGYHEIATLMQAIDLGDWLTLVESKSDLLTCSDPSLLCGETNLVMKALRLFRSFHRFPSVAIHLEKRIPVEAGLGGGSSNAATTLWALNEFSGRPATSEELMEMAAELGSDVPFFFSTGSAYCTGRGERVESVQIPEFSGFLSKPHYGLSTPRVYQETRVEELLAEDPRSTLLSFSGSTPHYYNDLEPAAFRLEPKLLSHKASLLDRFPTVLMTGSGSAFFCLGGAEHSFRSIQRNPTGWYQ